MRNFSGFSIKIGSMADRKKALVVAYDVIGPLMAGPGLRCLRLAEELAAHMPVDVLIGPESSRVEGSPAGFVELPDEGSEDNFLADYSVCLASSTFPLTHPWLAASDIPLGVDCYDPYVLENLFLYASLKREEARFQHERHLKAQVEALLRADLVLCASSRQKDLFTGALMALNRLNTGIAAEWGEDDLIKVVPFGIEEHEPPARGELRGKIPGYGEDDEILIWAGGIWEWFDPLNLIRAVDKLRGWHKNIRLHFLGVKHPNKHIPIPKRAKEAIDLAVELGLKDIHVFFGDWIPISERGKYLRDADLGVSFHKTGFETRYSFRTRLMDYLWAELPMVVSAGDDLSEEFASSGLGETIVKADAESIIGVVDWWLDKKSPPGLLEKFQSKKVQYRWSAVAKPLVEFFLNPRSTKGLRGEGFFETELGGMNPAVRPTGIKDVVRRVIRRR
jgi:glycosyltransferase involved in cell wall biosynthesis